MVRKGYGHLISKIITLGDFVCLNVAFLFLLILFPEMLPDGDSRKLVCLLLNLSYLPIAFFFRYVHNMRIVYVDRLLLIASESVFFGFLLFLACMACVKVDVDSMGLLLLFLFFFCFLNLWWLLSNRLLRYIRRRGYNFKRVIIVGAGSSGMSLYKELQSDAGYGFRFMGFFDDDTASMCEKEQLRGTIDDVVAFCIEKHIDEIYCALPNTQNAKIVDLLYFSEQNGIRFFILPEISQYIPRRLHYQIMGNTPLLSICREPLQRWTGRFVKRAFDFLFSLFMILLAPIWYLPIALLVRFSSPGPVLFKQKRTGYMGREFSCLKFRTMRLNAEADKLQATANDPRITRIGHFLRKTSLDELPQVFNIFKGEMSFVGPRPHMLKHTQEYSAIIDKYMVRHFAKPGLTGWAQINGYRGETRELWQMEKRVEYDIWYIENWNILLDLKIIFLTFVLLFKGDDNAV